MSKNIFNVLAMDDSDDEVQTKQQKDNKKQRRQKDQVLREAHGDHVQKDNSNRYNDRRQQNYQGNQHHHKREYDRRSGTGRRAQGGGYRKGGGFGKGNVAKDVEREVEQVDETKLQDNENTNEVQEPEEQKPQMKTLDEYMTDKSDKFSYLNKFKKSDDSEKNTKGKNKKKTNNVLIDTESFRGNNRRNRGRKNKGKKQKLNMNDEEFPSL